MSELVVEIRRTGWDLVFGILLIIAGVILLGDAAFATHLSVLFVGWTVLLAGIVGLLGAVFRIGKPGFWSAALTGGILTVLGIAMLRNTTAAAIALTLIAGSLFLVSGIVRLAVSSQEPDHRIPLLLAGAVSTVLGLIVLFNLVDASYKLLGILLGIQLLMDGFTMIMIGRAHLTAEPGEQYASSAS